MDCWCRESWGTSEVGWRGLSREWKFGCGQRDVEGVGQDEMVEGRSGRQGETACCQKTGLKGFVLDGILRRKKGTIVQLEGSQICCCM